MSGCDHGVDVIKLVIQFTSTRRDVEYSVGHGTELSSSVLNSWLYTTTKILAATRLKNKPQQYNAAAENK